jgi:hypothetical protein
MSDVQVKSIREILPPREDYRHFSPSSQLYTTADVLRQYLENGWVPQSGVTVESHVLSAGRSVNVYHICLRKDGAEIVLPILASPIVWRVIAEYKLTLTTSTPS